MNRWGRRMAGWVVLGIWALFLPAGWAVELIDGPRVEFGPQSGQATLRWRTDVEAGARVQWGTSPGKLTQRQQGPVGTQHAVVLRELKPGTTYHFTVGTARYPLATNAFVMPKGRGSLDRGDGAATRHNFRSERKCPIGDGIGGRRFHGITGRPTPGATYGSDLGFDAHASGPFRTAWKRFWSEGRR
jgi:hypothetical protein